MPVYEIMITAPAVNEIVVTSADDEQQAKERACYSALQRLGDAATIIVKEIPDQK